MLFLDSLAALVVKNGVALGGLTEPQRALALGLVWAGLPRERVLSEREVNEALKRLLVDTAACLDTDHVELRRWLVDCGWLSRDGFGREYRCVALAALPAQHQPIAQALSGLDTGAWAAQARTQFEAERAARRAKWERHSLGRTPG